MIIFILSIAKADIEFHYSKKLLVNIKITWTFTFQALD